ncbi:hypothetical protein EG68_01897 [Paragonimus skrjabini miyazakii]|uniref:Tetratricopeptide repeat protein 27 n=1 Tax=Paragonimus skrjabini miyazakii TaxID=59628 RepID=A0A8S9Z2L9_9TREM|nr:hypothetical protein EG68_01897 [Paragonimus skrjabini miyazakii]
MLAKIRSIFSEIAVEKLTDEQLINILLERSISVFAFVDYMLCKFVSINFLGGRDDDADIVGSEKLDNPAAEALVCEGEAPFQQAKYLGIFWLCKRISKRMCEISKTLLFPYLLFSLKCVYLHQYLIGQERSQQLDQEFQDLVEACESELSLHDSVAHEEQTCYLLLSAYLSVFYYRYEIANDFAERCSNHLQLTINFSGALGKRTRFQKTDVANLWIQIHRTHELNGAVSCDPPILPKIVSLNDDTLLNTVVFSCDVAKQNPMLSPEEQSLVLLLCELHRLAHPRDELTCEQRLAYITTVLQQAYPTSKDNGRSYSSWPIATEALFRRSLIEHSSVRKTERAVSQLEELVNQFDRPDPPACERGSEYFFLTRMPSVWVLNIEQARLLKKLGCYKSALDVFLRWNQWFDIIDCYTHLNKREKAEELIRAQLDSGNQSPELYCALGDVTNNRVYYVQAWDVSEHRSARAMRSLAIVHMYIDKDYEKAIECFEKSLSINNLQASLWFTFGCCCLQAKQYTKAENAFRRCVQIDPENFEAWNNCASAAVLGGKKEVALKLLKEACKYNFENWRIWENISIISVDVGCFSDTIQACHRLLDLREKFSDDQVLAALTLAVTDDVMDQSEQPASRLRPKLLELFGRVTASNSASAEVWRLYATLLLDEKPSLQPVTFQRAVQYLQTAHRCRVQPGEGNWEQSVEKRKIVVDGLHTWANIVLDAHKLIPSNPESTSGSDIHTVGQQTFINSNLASLRLSIISVKGRFKLAEESTVCPKVQEDIHKLSDDLDILLATIEKHLEQ